MHVEIPIRTFVNTYIRWRPEATSQIKLTSQRTQFTTQRTQFTSQPTQFTTQRCALCCELYTIHTTQRCALCCELCTF